MFATPAGEIGTIHVFSEGILDLHEDPPPTRSSETVVVIERASDEMADGTLRLRMPRSMAPGGSRSPVDDFATHVLRKREEIGVGRAPAERLRHSADILA